MSDSNSVWAIVLAAGDGRRLRRLTTTRGGLAIPKQFCSLERGPSLLQEAIARAAGVAPPERICAVVSERHERWWSGQLAGVPRDNIIVQPDNRGTAIGVLLPLLRILERDPQARVVLLPSDHHVRDEWRLAQSLRSATVPIAVTPPPIVLLGVEPCRPDTQLGYIVPHPEAGSIDHAVARFVEKPGVSDAEALVDQGALWNTFIIAADAPALLALFERRYPDIVMAMRSGVRAALAGKPASAGLAGLYQLLPELDFSRAVLQGQEARLRVLSVPECGWSDLGTPDRVAEALDGLRRCKREPANTATREVLLSLAAQQRQLGGAAARH